MEVSGQELILKLELVLLVPLLDGVSDRELVLMLVFLSSVQVLVFLSSVPGSDEELDLVWEIVLLVPVLVPQWALWMEETTVLLLDQQSARWSALALVLQWGLGSDQVLGQE